MKTLSKMEKKEIASTLYKDEEARWGNLTRSYYQPRGAPGRLSESLLEQYHEKNNTGVSHPQDVSRVLVKVMYDQMSFSVRHFVTQTGAEKYIESLASHNIDSHIIAEGESLL